MCFCLPNALGSNWRYLNVICLNVTCAFSKTFISMSSLLLLIVYTTIFCMFYVVAILAACNVPIQLRFYNGMILLWCKKAGFRFTNFEVFSPCRLYCYCSNCTYLLWNAILTYTISLLLSGRNSCYGFIYVLAKFIFVSYDLECLGAIPDHSSPG